MFFSVNRKMNRQNVNQAQFNEEIDTLRACAASMVDSFIAFYDPFPDPLQFDAFYNDFKDRAKILNQIGNFLHEAIRWNNEFEYYRPTKVYLRSTIQKIWNLVRNASTFIDFDLIKDRLNLELQVLNQTYDIIDTIRRTLPHVNNNEM